MTMKLALMLSVVVVALQHSCLALDNGVARLPPMGYNQWNFFHNNFNTSLFMETATFMKEKGFLAAGYNYMTLGGIGYANGSTCQPASSCNITRNATGFLQVDPVRFPGGNEGFTVMTDSIRAMGYKWGSYTEAGTSGCNGAIGSSEGYEEQDNALFVTQWKSEYLMVDSCGVQQRPPPHGPPPNYPGGQARWELTKWKSLLSTAPKPVLLHNCHNGCASGFGGPTLEARPCSAADPTQSWLMQTDGSKTALVSTANGLCGGCGNFPMTNDGRGEDSCANDAAPDPGRAPTNSTLPRRGLGMGACLTSSAGNGAGGPLPGGGQGGQVFNYSEKSGFITHQPGGVGLGTQCLTYTNVPDGGGGNQVVVAPEGAGPCNATYGAWDTVPVAGGADGAVSLQLRSVSGGGGGKLCLAYTEFVPAFEDPWCLENNNMWRSSTDTLQVWTRVMVEVESMATQGNISRPGAWSFPDAFEVGTPGGNTLTWEEAKTNVALFAVSSSPLFLGNDPRENRMQDRAVGLLLNPDMIAINQQYSESAAYAGGRIKSVFPAQELWAKPLVIPKDGVAVVLFNRGGLVMGVNAGQPLQPHCSDPTSTLGPCTGCFIDQDAPQLSPCNDNVTASSGAQALTLDFADLNASWLGLSGPADGSSHGSISCDVFDVFGCAAASCSTTGAAKGAGLGRFTGNFSATIPPHGSRFLRLSGCSQ